MKNIKNLVLSLIISAVIFLGLNYAFLMPVNIYFFQSIFLFLLIFFLVFNFMSGNDKLKRKNSNNFSYMKNDFKADFTFKGSFMAKINAGLLAVIALYLVISFATSAVMLHSNAYANLIGEVDVPEDFVKDFSQVDENNLPIVDHDLAEQLGDKEFGKYGSLGSQFNLGEFSDVKVGNNLYAIAPLEYNGVFQWFNNLDGTPGYTKVDKVSAETTIVTTKAFKYTTTSYFNTNIKRHIYYNGGMFYKLDNFSIELDDNNQPFWVVSAELPQIGLSGGYDVVGIFIVDPLTGDTQYYKTENVPDWVDTVYPKDIIIDQLNDYGLYQGGFINSLFAKRDCLTTTYGSRRVYDEDNVYHYTGLTSIASDEATVGFVFVNTNTKEVSRYSMAGATEYAAMESAAGKVQNYGYESTFPIPVNLYNEPTFFVTLKDNKGLIKKYAFVNINEFSLVGIGDTIDVAKNDYASQINQDITDYDLNDIVTIQGNVLRINQVIVSSETYYYILLDDNNMYKLPLRLNESLVVTEDGDDIEIKSMNGNYVSFKNITINK